MVLYIELMKFERLLDKCSSANTP